MAIIHADLLAEIDAYRAKHDMARSEFGRLALNDTKLVFELLEGRELKRGTEARIRAFMAEDRRS